MAGGLDKPEVSTPAYVDIHPALLMEVSAVTTSQRMGLSWQVGATWTDMKGIAGEEMRDAMSILSELD